MLDSLLINVGSNKKRGIAHSRNFFSCFIVLYCMRFFNRKYLKYFRLFRNKVDDLVWYIDFFDEVLAFKEGSNSLISFGNLKGLLFLTAIRKNYGSSYFTVYLHTDLNGLGNGFALIIFRPRSNCKQTLASQEFPDLLTEMWSKRT